MILDFGYKLLGSSMYLPGISPVHGCDDKGLTSQSIFSCTRTSI